MKIDLVGPLRVSASQGADLTPVGKKNKGLLAILATSPGLRCSRSKLQDKLWSERPQEQGSNSLRQALTVLRRALNTQEEVLVTHEDWVELNPDFAQVTLEPRAISSSNMMPEFAEGLQVNDPEFEDWIRDQRTHYERAWLEKMAEKGRSSAYPYERDLQHVTNIPTLIVVAMPVCDDPELQFAAQITLRDAAKRACSYGDFVVVDRGRNV